MTEKNRVFEENQEIKLSRISSIWTNQSLKYVPGNNMNLSWDLEKNNPFFMWLIDFI